MNDEQQYNIDEKPLPKPTRQGLRYVGSDLPKSGQVNFDPNLPFDAPNTKGFNYLEQGGKFLTGAAEYEAKGAQQRYQSMQAGMEAVDRSIAVSAESATRAAQAKMSQAQSPSGFETIISAVGELVKQRKADEDAKNKALNQQEYLQAFTQLQELKTSWRQSGLDEHGTIAYQKALQQLVTKYPSLNPDQIQKLVDDGYGVALQYATEKSHKQQKTLTEIADAQRTSLVMGMQLSINSDLKELKNTVVDDPQPILDRIDKKIQQTLTTEGLDPLTGVMILNASLKSTLEAMDDRNDTYFALKQRSETLGEYAAFVEDLNRKVEAGEMTSGQRKWAIQQWRNDNNLQGNIDETNPFDADREYKEYLERDRQIRSLEEQNAISKAEKLQMSDKNISYLAWGIIQNPATLEVVKANKAFSHVPGVQSAVQLAELYIKGEKERNSLNLQIQSTRQNIAELDQRGFNWFLEKSRTNKSDPSTKAILDSLGLGIALPQGKEPLTPQQEQQARAAFSAVRQEYVRRMSILEDQWAKSYGPLSSYGLVGSKEAINARITGYKSEYDAFVNNFGKQVTAPSGRLGTTSPFDASQGKKRSGGVQFQTTKYQGKTVSLPFLQGSNPSTWENYAQDRGTHTHAGEDIAVPEGTPIVTPVRGRVTHIGWDTNGYGQYMDVLGADGMLYRYTHLQRGAFFARVGQEVDVGDKLARSGNTGRSTGAHLHWEIRDPNKPYGFDGTVDPLKYLASRPDVKPSQYAKSRTLNDKSWRLPSTATPTLGSIERVPANAIPLPNGYYILGNQIKKLNNPGVSRDVGSITSGNPIQKTGTRGSKRNDPDDNYGYSVLASDEPFRRKLSDVSTKLGISAQWLADVMAFESGGFKADIINGIGCVGLIQFCPGGGLDETGKSASELARMSRAGQMEYVYRYLKKFGSQIQKGPEYVLASIWGGQGLLDAIQQRGLKQVMADPKWNDCGPGQSPGNGCVTFGQYVSKLGASAGRNYLTASSRGDKLRTATHTSYRSSCSLCKQLKDAGSPFIPHESYG